MEERTRTLIIALILAWFTQDQEELDSIIVELFQNKLILPETDREQFYQALNYKLSEMRGAQK